MVNYMHNEERTSTGMVPYGLVVTRQWLLKQGVEVYTIDNWVKSNQIESVVNGVYKRPDAKLTWEGIVCSLQRMKDYDLAPGGLTALEMQGMGHYLALSSKKVIHLYGTSKLPTWLNKLLPEVTFVRHNADVLFHKPYARMVNQVYDTKGARLRHDDPLHGAFLTNIAWGLNEWPLTISQPEQAILEVLEDVPDKISFEHADQLMQGMTSLSPRRLGKLFNECTNVKVRRLFLWFGERYRHAWLDKLDSKCFSELGAGKRALVKGGKLDPKYLITVPPEMFKPQDNHGQK